MALLETDTLSNQNIATALAIGAYTVGTGINFVMCDVSVAQVAGNDTYTVHLTRQINGTGSTYVNYDKTASTVASGDTAVGWQSGIISCVAGDVLTVYLDGASTDTTTPDTIVRWYDAGPLQPTTAGRLLDVTATGGAGLDWSNVEAPTSTVGLTNTTVGTATALGADAITSTSLAATATAEIAAADWAYTTRTLTQSAASVTSTVSGTKLTITRGDTLTAAFTGLSANTGYVSLDFSVKRNREDADTAAIIRIRKNATGLTDGLLYLNGAAAATAANGSITVVSSTALTVTLAAAETDDLSAEQGLYYDLQMITATAVTTLTDGACDVVADVTKAVA